MFEEQNTLYKRLVDGVITKNELHEEMKKTGRILIQSNKEMSEQEAYELYKKRATVEKSLIPTKRHYLLIRLYLQDDESVFGHVFIAFLFFAPAASWN